MAEVLLLAVDLGTSFIKTGAYTTDGVCVAAEMEAVRDYRPGPGVFIQKGEELLESVISCIKKTADHLGDRAGNIEAIAFTGQMSGFMGVDQDWNDVTSWSCSLDNRYMPYARRQMEQLQEEFLVIGGTNFPQMAPKYEWYRNEFPEESKRIVKYVMISGYVIGQLGELAIEEAVMDRSYTEWTGLADVNHDCWSDKICDTIGLDRKYLPQIVNSNHICTRLSRRSAGLTGLKAGIPLVSGAGDKAAGCLGAGIVNYGDTIFEASSYGAISTCIPEYRPDYQDGRLDVVPSAIPGEYYAIHFIAGSGITLDWYMNTFVRTEGLGTAEMFAMIEKEAARIPIGCDGLMAIGLLGGNSMPCDGALRGMWMGHDWSHGKAHFYRALLESYSYDFGLCLDSIERLYPECEIDKIRIIGGGAKSSIWPQMCADVQGKKYARLNRNDVAMWGAAILAGNAVGIFPDMKETATSHVSEMAEIRPDLAKQADYRKYKEIYRDYILELHPYFERLQKKGGDQ